MTPVTRKPSKTLQELLLERLKAIPEGAVAHTARAAGLPVRHIVRLRQGKSLDVRLSTLERLAAGLGVTAAELLTDPSVGGLTAAEIRSIAAPTKPLPTIPARKLRTLQRQVDRVFEELSKYGERDEDDDA